MALKPYRLINQYADDISFFMDEVADVGGFVCLSTGGSGAAMDQAAAKVTYAASQSGQTCLGVLLVPAVNKDLTQNHLNWYNGEVQKGGKVRINSASQVQTNFILGTPAAGGKAYLGPSGYCQTTSVNAANNPQIGVFLSSKDEDGYAKVKVSV